MQFAMGHRFWRGKTGNTDLPYGQKGLRTTGCIHGRQVKKRAPDGFGAKDRRNHSGQDQERQFLDEWQKQKAQMALGFLDPSLHLSQCCCLICPYPPMDFTLNPILGV
jgi:hypothetical protein